MQLSLSLPSTSRALAPSVKVASVGQKRYAKQQRTSTSHGTYKGKFESKKYSRKEYDSMSMAQHQQLYELLKKIRLMKRKKTSESSRALEARVAMLKAKTDSSKTQS